MTVPIIKKVNAIMSINLMGTKSLIATTFSPLKSRNMRFMSTSVFAGRKKNTGIGVVR
jgi:hypothetical protein